MRHYNKLILVGYDPEGHEPCNSCLKEGKEAVVIEHDGSLLTLCWNDLKKYLRTHALGSNSRGDVTALASAARLDGDGRE